MMFNDIPIGMENENRDDYNFDAPTSGNFRDLTVNDTDWFDRLHETDQESLDTIDPDSSIEIHDILDENKENALNNDMSHANKGIRKPSKYGLGKNNELKPHENFERSLGKIHETFLELIKETETEGNLKLVNPLIKLDENVECNSNDNDNIPPKLPFTATPTVNLLKSDAPAKPQKIVTSILRKPGQNAILSTNIRKPNPPKATFTLPSSMATVIKPKQVQTINRLAMTSVKPAMPPRFVHTLPKVISKKPLTVPKGPSFMSGDRNNALTVVSNSSTVQGNQTIVERKIVSNPTPFSKPRVISTQNLIKDKIKTAPVTVANRPIFMANTSNNVNVCRPRSATLDKKQVPVQKITRALTAVSNSSTVQGNKTIAEKKIVSNPTPFSKPRVISTQNLIKDKIKTAQTPATKLLVSDRKVLQRKPIIWNSNKVTQKSNLRQDLK